MHGNRRVLKKIKKQRRMFERKQYKTPEIVLMKWW